MLKAVLFDLDDTLIDWADFNIGWEVMEAAHLHNVHTYLSGFAPIGNPKVLIDEYTRRVRESWVEARITLRSPHLGRLLVDSAVAIGVPIDRVDMQRCLDAYGWSAVKGITLFPEVIDILKLLIKRGLKLGIVTNSFHPMILRDLELQEFGIFEFFPDCRVTAADVGYLKPHVEIFEAALAKLKITADEAVFVGDNPVADIAGAQSAGMKAVLRRREDKLPTTSSLVLPDATIYSLTELPAILDQWFPK